MRREFYGVGIIPINLLRKCKLHTIRIKKHPSLPPIGARGNVGSDK